MTLSIIIPCYNEASTIHQVVDRINHSGLGTTEIIIIDDGSTDNTKKILKQELESNTVKVLYHSKNQGKGAAIRSGFQVATGDFIVIQDADLECNPEDLPNLLDVLTTSRADAVYGSRFSGMYAFKPSYRFFMLGNRLATGLSNLLSGTNLTDMATCYKMLRREIINKLTIEENRFGVDAEITAKIAKMNLQIKEVGISYRGRTYAEGKKFTLLDGIRVFYAIFKYNLRQRR